MSRKKVVNITFFYLAVFVSSLALANDNFLLLDSLGLAGKPDTEPLGFFQVRPISTGSLWPKGGDLSEPNFPTIESAIKRYPNPLGIICLDIEHWSTSTSSEKELKESIRKYTSVADFVSDKFPEQKMGFYSMVPTREYNAIKNKNGKQLEKWYEQNEKLIPIAKSVDIIFPSIYAFYNDIETWKAYAKENIEQARKYGKKVIVFMWPQLHGSNKKEGYSFVNYEFWRIQLETAYKYADGIALWTPWGKHRTEFNPEAEWWKATLDFIAEHELNKTYKEQEKPLPPTIQ